VKTRNYHHGSQFTSEYLHTRRRRRNRKCRNIFLILFVVIFFLVSFFVFRLLSGRGGEISSPIENLSGFIEEEKSEGSELLNIIENEVAQEEGDYSVVVKTLEGDREEAAYMEDEIYWSASLYKLWVMATVFEQIEEEELTITRKLSANVEELNKQYDIATESAELTEGEVGGSVGELLNRMITISGNYEAYLLGRTVGMSNVQNFIEENGWDNSRVGSPPQTTARDIADYFEKLYFGELVSEDASSEMLELLSQQRLNDRIPAGVPENTRIAHKTGELEGYKHDAGIVYAPFGDYIIVVLTDTPSQARAVEVTARLSERVWEYLEKKTGEN